MFAWEQDRYNQRNPEVIFMEEASEQAWRDSIARVRRLEVRLDETFVFDRDLGDVIAERVIYPGASLPFVSAVLAGELD